MTRLLLRFLMFLILMSFGYSFAKGATNDFVCYRDRQTVTKPYTYHVATPQSCSSLCDLAVETAGTVCDELGVDLHVTIQNKDIAGCGGATAQNTSCTLTVHCDACPR